MRYIETQTFELFWTLFPILCIILAASLFVSIVKYIADGDEKHNIWFFLFKYNFAQGLFNFTGLMIVISTLLVKFLHHLNVFLQ